MICGICTALADYGVQLAKLQEQRATIEAL